jgi:hypothetical protein
MKDYDFSETVIYWQPDCADPDFELDDEDLEISGYSTLNEAEAYAEKGTKIGRRDAGDLDDKLVRSRCACALQHRLPFGPKTRSALGAPASHTLIACATG